MCLDISPIQKKRYKPRFVYKFYIKKDNKVISYYRYNEYSLNKGKFIQSNRYTTKIGEYENQRGEINVGFHVYTRLSDIKGKVNRKRAGSHYDFVIAKFEGMPEDFVGRGTFDGKPSEVYTRLKFIKFIEYNSYAPSRIQQKD